METKYEARLSLWDEESAKKQWLLPAFLFGRNKYGSLPALVLKSDNSVLLHIFLSSSCPSIGAKSEEVQVNPWTSPLRGIPGTPAVLCLT